MAARVASTQYRPQQKFVIQLIGALLIARDVLITKLAHVLSPIRRHRKRARRTPLAPTRNAAALNYICRNLASLRLDYEAIDDAALQHAGELLAHHDPRDIVVRVDGSAIAKDHCDLRAPGSMQYARYVHDNARRDRRRRIAADGRQKARSPGTRVPGYDLVVASATGPEEVPVPLVLHAYTLDVPSVLSQADEHRRMITRCATVCPAAIYVMDRWYDANPFYAHCDELGLRWCVRAKLNGNRKLFSARGEHLTVRELAMDTEPRLYREIRTGRRGRKKRTGIGWRQVTLGKDGRPWGPRRTLIVVWGRRTDPWTLLVHGVLRSSAEVERYVRAFEPVAHRRGHPARERQATMGFQPQ